MIKLVVGLHYGCLHSNQKVFWGDEASDRASPLEPQGGGASDGASP